LCSDIFVSFAAQRFFLLFSILFLLPLSILEGEKSPSRLCEASGEARMKYQHPYSCFSSLLHVFFVHLSRFLFVLSCSVPSRFHFLLFSDFAPILFQSFPLGYLAILGKPGTRFFVALDGSRFQL
jgi:hypothetical protein